MLNPSVEKELNSSYKLSKEKARRWWNSQAFESRKNIVIESEVVINEDEDIENKIIEDIAGSDYENLPDKTKQEIDSQVDEEEGMEEIFNVNGEEYLQCSKCDEVFTSNEDYDTHKSVDHGEDPEDLEESEKSFQLSMNPELTIESLREINNFLTETEEKELYAGYDKTGKIQSSVMPYNVPPVATGKYDDNPNSFFYSNKIFRNGSSTERNSALGEARASENWDNEIDIEKLLKDHEHDYDIEGNCKVCGWSMDQIQSVDLNLDLDLHPDELRKKLTESKANESLDEEKQRWLNARNEAMMGNRQPFIELVRQGGGDVDLAESDSIDGVIQQIDMEIDNFNSGFYGENAVANENKTYTCDKCGKVGDSFSGMAQEECPADSPNNHQIPIFGDQVKPRGMVDRGNWDALGMHQESYASEGRTMEQVWNQYFEQAGTDNSHVGWLDFAKSKGISGGDAEFKWNEESYKSYQFHSNSDVSESKASEDDYDQVEYEDDGVSDISVPNTEPKDDKNEFLDDVDIKLEEVNFVYPTKSNESTKSYITEAEDGLDEEYEGEEDSEKEEIEETITLRKLNGYSDNSIARELHIKYGVSHEEALEKVYSVEVSTNDKVAQTFFGKMFKECTESEKDELRMYSGSD